MNTKLMTIFTRTPLHVGAGSSVGAIDLPIARERHTCFPVIPGSSIKGVLADLWNGKLGQTTSRSEEGMKLFGSTDSSHAMAGNLLIGEGRLLAFPVRSAKGCFAWITCSLVLNRFYQDKGLSGHLKNLPENAVAVAADSEIRFEGKKVVFEEYTLDIANTFPEKTLDLLKELVTDSVWLEIPGKIALVSDEMFQYFVVNTCEVAQHIKIDDDKGVVAKGALFSQENVPSEALFYSVLNEREVGMIDALDRGLAEENHLLQIGADMTTGLGWCSVKLV